MGVMVQNIVALFIEHGRRR